jgi:hypothetical protein
MTHLSRIIRRGPGAVNRFSPSCRRDPYKVNVSGIELDLRIRDLGSEVFQHSSERDGSQG